MIKNIKSLVLFNIFFFLLIFIFFQYENLYFLKNAIFPWDAVVFKDLALSFFDENFKDNVPYINTLIYHPHSSKLLYPLVTGYLHLKLNIELIQIMFLVNLCSIYLTSLISFFLLRKFINKDSIILITIFLCLLIWNGPLRATFYNPASAYAFDTFLISLTSASIFFLDDNKKHNLFIICILIFILSLQRFIISAFIVVVPIMLNHLLSLNFKKKNIKNLIKINLTNSHKAMLITLLIAFLFIFFNSEQLGSYSRIKFIIKFAYFHLNPLEFIYTYYYAYGAFVLISLILLVDKKKRNLFFLKLKKIEKKKRFFIYSIIITSIILSTIGGDDSDRILFLFFIWHLIIFSISLEIIFDEKKKIILIIFFISHIFGARTFVPGIPNFTISDTFLYYSQRTTTNFDDKYFYGPNFIKKFKNKTEIYNLNSLEGIFLDNKSKIIPTHLPVGKIKSDNSINIYVQPYKYRLNDIPFPLGYIHNQRNALVDHPWHGKWWVRLIFISQWIFLQFLCLFIQYYRKK